MEHVLVVFLYINIFLLLIYFDIKKYSLTSPEVFMLFFIFIAVYPVIRNFGQELNAIITVLYLIFIWSYMLGCGYAKAINSAPVNKHRSWNIERLFKIGIAVFAFSMILWYVGVELTGGFEALLSSSRQEKMLSGRAYGFLGIYNDLLIVSIVLLAVTYYKTGKKAVLIILSIAVGIKILIALVYTSRNFILEVLMLIIVFREFFHNKRISVRYSVALLVLVIIFGAMFKGVTRNLIISGEIGEISVNIEPGMLQTQYTVIKDIIKYDDIDLDQKFGIGYIKAIFLRSNPFINSPSNSSWYAKKIYKDKYDRGGGQGFSQIAEGFMAFGPIGVVLVGFFYGYLLRYIYQRAIHKNLLFISIYSIMIMSVIRILRSEFTSVFNGYFMYRVIPILIFFWIARLSYKKITADRK